MRAFILILLIVLSGCNNIEQVNHVEQQKQTYEDKEIYRVIISDGRVTYKGKNNKVIVKGEDKKIILHLNDELYKNIKKEDIVDVIYDTLTRKTILTKK